MRKIFVSMLAVVIAFSAVAQENKSDNKQGDNRRGPQSVGRQGTIGALKSVNLTDAQKQQLEVLNNNFKAQMHELNTNENITVKEQREKREALTKQHQANVQALLTADQRKELQESRKNKMDNGEKGNKDWKEKKHKGVAKGNMGAGDGGKRDDLRQLNLTDDQSTRIKSVNDDFKTQLQSIQKNTSLSNEQKKAKRQAAQEQHTAAIKAILTAEQKQKLEALKATRGDRKAKK